MISLTPEEREKNAKRSEWLRMLEQQLSLVRQNSRVAADPKHQYRNAIYLGRASSEFGDFLYVGQSRFPLKRWKSHVRRSTGCMPFGSSSWAILLWDVPVRDLDATESYLIGYVFAKWRCVNMNRGNVGDAFDIGFRDGILGHAPQVCAQIEMNKLLWNKVCIYECGTITGYVPSGELLHRRWGFHLVQHDFDKAVAIEVAQQTLQLEAVLKHRQTKVLEKEQQLQDTVDTAFLRGWLWGALIAFAIGVIIYASKQ